MQFFSFTGAGGTMKLSDLPGAIKNAFEKGAKTTYGLSNQDDAAKEIVWALASDPAALMPGGLLYPAVDKADPTKLNIRTAEALLEMKHAQILKDSIWTKLITGGFTGAEAADKYKAARAQEVADRVAGVKDGVVYHLMDRQKLVHLTEEETLFFKNMAEQMKAFNKGATRKGPNQTMVAALDQVLDQNPITVGALIDLNKAATEYFDARKGRFFSPRTKEGKWRLQASVDLAERTKGLLTDRVNRGTRLREEPYESFLKCIPGSKFYEPFLEPNEALIGSGANTRIITVKNPGNRQFLRDLRRDRLMEEANLVKGTSEEYHTQELRRFAARIFLLDQVDRYGIPKNGSGKEEDLTATCSRMAYSRSFEMALKKTVPGTFCLSSVISFLDTPDGFEKLSKQFVIEQQQLEAEQKGAARTAQQPSMNAAPATTATTTTTPPEAEKKAPTAEAKPAPTLRK